MQRRSLPIVAATAVLLLTAGLIAVSGVSAGSAQQEQYVCPMHPDTKLNSPGKCPKCGMPLLAAAPDASGTIASRTTPARWGPDYFPNVPLITQDGKVVRFYDDLLKDKLVAIDLIYTHCRDSCPLETARLVQVQKLLGDRVGKDIFFYSISIDPERDTPAELKAYAEKYHVGPGWLFLTGKKEDIELISKKLGLYSRPDPSNRDGHTPTLMVGNVPAAQWMKNSALDNPRFLSLMIGQFMDGYKRREEAPMPDYTKATKLSGDQGRYLFATRCAPCHTIGHGVRVGPDLLGVTSLRNRVWLTRMIAAPDELLAEKDPLATALFNEYNRVQMPNLRLSESDVSALISFLESQAVSQ